MLRVEHLAAIWKCPSGQGLGLLKVGYENKLENPAARLSPAKELSYAESFHFFNRMVSCLHLIFFSLYLQPSCCVSLVSCLGFTSQPEVLGVEENVRRED